MSENQNRSLRRTKSSSVINMEGVGDFQGSRGFASPTKNYGTITVKQTECNNNPVKSKVSTKTKKEKEDKHIKHKKTDSNGKKEKYPNSSSKETDGGDETKGKDIESIRTRKRSYMKGMSIEPVPITINPDLYPPLLPKIRKPSVDQEKGKQGPKRHQHLGLILTMISSVFSSLSALTVKLLEDDFHPFLISFWRFCVIFVIASCALIVTATCSSTSIWPKLEEKYDHAKTILLLGVRGLLGCTARVLYVYSITCMDLGDAMVIASSTPVFMTLFAYILIGEKCGIVPVLVSFGTLVGVAVITKPPFITGGESYDHELLVGTETGMGGMIMMTIVMIVMRKIRKVHHTLHTLSLASFGMLVSLALTQYYHKFAVPTNLVHILLVLASGATSFLGQTFLTLGLKFENAGPVALIKNFDVVFAFIWSFIFLNVSPDFYSLGGGCIVIFCIIISSGRKWLEGLHEDSDIRQRLQFLLK